jgi:5-methylcytosine-specific restriction endonuclease McrA
VKQGTISEHLHLAYANLAMAHAAVSAGAATFAAAHYAIRSRLLRGLSDGSMQPRSMVEDERPKLATPPACCYCGASGRLTLDHLISQALGGLESADNIVWACRSCISSKGSRDLMRWYADRGAFPPLLLLRRYLKLVLRHCEEKGLMDCALSDGPPLPFDLAAIPKKFPAPGSLVLWQPPAIGSAEPTGKA